MKLQTFYTTSSTVFDEATWLNNILTLYMRSHKVYAYRDVPEKIWKDFKKTASHGSYFNTYIKHNYQFIRKL